MKFWMSRGKASAQMFALLIAVVAVSIGLAACPSPDTSIVSLSATPGTLSIAAGDHSTVVLSAIDSNGASVAVAATSAAWSSDASGVASVADGVVTGVAAGTATVTASYGGRSAAVAVTVTPVGVAPRVVFADDYATGASFAAFGGSTNDITVDATVAHSGSASLKVVVPAAGYTGGSIVASAPADLGAYDAVTFWAKASTAMDINVTGLGNDASGGAALSVERNAAALTTAWQKFAIPMPNPAKATAVVGLFHFAESGPACTFWLDDVQYEKLAAGAYSLVSASIPTASLSLEAGGSSAIAGCSAVYSIDGTDVTLPLGPSWYDFVSSGAAASVAAGSVVASASGSADITATLAGGAAAGTISVTVTEPFSPTTEPPVPTAAAAGVVSLLSQGHYTDIPVGSWGTSWDDATVADFNVGAAVLKKVTLTGWGLGIEGFQFDATGKTKLHIDYWTHNGTKLAVKVVDFGADGAYGGGDDKEIVVSATAVAADAWTGFDFDFSTLATLGHISQILILPDGGAAGQIYFLGNMYAY